MVIRFFKNEYGRTYLLLLINYVKFEGNLVDYWNVLLEIHQHIEKRKIGNLVRSIKEMGLCLPNSVHDMCT